MTSTQQEPAQITPRDPRDMRAKAIDFAEAMEFELNANAHKGDWMPVDNEVHAEEAIYHLWKLTVSIASAEPHRVREHAADVANIVMFLADKNGGMDVPSDTVSYRVRDDLPDYPRWVEGIAERIKERQAKTGRVKAGDGAQGDY